MEHQVRGSTTLRLAGS